MNITVIGPNLPDQSKGTFHVHAAQCSHVVPAKDRANNFAYRHNRMGIVDGFTAEYASAEEVVMDVYGDMMEESDTDLSAYLSDFHFAPCVKW